MRSSILKAFRTWISIPNHHSLTTPSRFAPTLLPNNYLCAIVLSRGFASPAAAARMTNNGDVSGAGEVPNNIESIAAAMWVQKVYRSYHTRHMLADSAVVAEELWWQAIDYARLNRSTISFFKFSKPETVASWWNRIRLNASKCMSRIPTSCDAQRCEKICKRMASCLERL
ncbi:unnamed protein product [Camellia sinensis]